MSPNCGQKRAKKANKMISYLNFQANRSKSSAIIRILAIQKQVRTCLFTLTLSTEQLFPCVFSQVFPILWFLFFWRFSKTIKFLVETSQNMSSHFNVVNWATVAPCVFTSFFFTWLLCDSLVSRIFHKTKQLNVCGVTQLMNCY